MPPYNEVGHNGYSSSTRQWTGCASPDKAEFATGGLTIRGSRQRPHSRLSRHLDFQTRNAVHPSQRKIHTWGPETPLIYDCPSIHPQIHQSFKDPAPLDQGGGGSSSTKTQYIFTGTTRKGHHRYEVSDTLIHQAYTTEL
jgi:hypothetical protein